MARKSSGQDILEVAKAYLSKAKTLEAFKQVQAVVFPIPDTVGVLNLFAPCVIQ